MRFVLTIALLACIVGCDVQQRRQTSDSTQQDQQEKMLGEATASVGMPAIKNFRERRLLKEILELRDQTGLVTYTYLENLTPTIIKGKTALGGKLTYLGESVGYGIPYATQFTNPQKVEYYRAGDGRWSNYTIPQADPNSLFSPGSAEGTWILLKNPNGSETKPVYVEPRTVVSPFKLEVD